MRGNDWMDYETKSGKMVRVLDYEHEKRSDIRIRTRMWLMTRFGPKVFGDRMQPGAGKETREAIAARRGRRSGWRGALALIARATRRVAEALESGEIIQG